MPALNKTRIPNPNSTIALTAGDHHVAVLEPEEAAVHGAARQDNAALALAVSPLDNQWRQTFAKVVTPKSIEGCAVRT